jgi:uncharacterized protein
MDNYELQHKLIEFCRRLRGEQMKVNQVNTLVAAESLNLIQLLDKDQFYYVLRAALCFSPEDIRRFDRVFRGFWGEDPQHAGKEQRVESGDDEAEPENRHDPDAVEYEWADQSAGGESAGDEADDTLLDSSLREEVTRKSRYNTYSPDERLEAKTFRIDPLFVPELTEEMELLLRLLKRSMAPDSAKSGRDVLNLKRTIRKSMQYGGQELFRLYKRGRSKQRNQLLVSLIDISGSMEAFLPTYLPLLYQLHRFSGSSQMYVFNTTVYPVHDLLKTHYFDLSQKLNQKLSYVSNGTNLGQSLRQFRQSHGSVLSPENTTFLIFSDGWDRGDMQRLREELSSLKKQVHQIIWLNPMLGTHGYLPVTQALETAAPYISGMVSDKDMKALLR